MTNIATIAREYIAKKNLIDSLTKELDGLKAKIVEYHHGRDLVTEAGIESKLIHATRENLIKAEIEKALGGTIPESCKKYTSYDRLSVKLVA